MERRKPLKGDPAKDRAWRQRSAERAQAARRDPQDVVRNRKPRKSQARNDSSWRAACIAEYGEYCKACGTSRDIQMDHLKPRSQQGKSDIENGLPLCRTHHEQKTNSELKIRYEWLTPEQAAYLAKVGWVQWDETGQPYGEGWKHFADRG